MASSVINAFQQRFAEIRLQDEARSRKPSTMQHDSALEGWQHVAISESSANRLQAATRVNAEVGVNAEKHLAPLSFAAQAASQWNTRESLYNEIAAEMSNAIDASVAAKSLLTESGDMISGLQEEPTTDMGRTRPTTFSGATPRLSSLEQVQLLAERCWAFEMRQRSQEERLLAILGTSLDGHKLETGGALLSRLELLEEKVADLERCKGTVKDQPVANVATPQKGSPVDIDSLTIEDESQRQGQRHADNLLDLDAALHSLEEQVKSLSNSYMTLRSSMETLQDKEDVRQNASQEEQDVEDKPTLRTFVRQLDDTFELHGSVWDLTLLIGLPALRPGASLHSALIWMLNFCLQLSFLVVCSYNMTTPTVDQTTVAGAKYFRTMLGHNDEYVSPGGKNLQQMICDATPTMQLLEGVFQSNTLSVFDNYLRSDANIWGYSFNGETMCALALMYWSLIIIREVNVMMSTIRAVATLPRGDETSLMLDSDQLVFMHLSILRLLGVIIVLIIRLAICIGLWIVGSFWLAHETVVSNLLLNCLALGFIVDIDEMIFEALVSDRTKLVLLSVRPLKIHQWPNFHGLEYRALAFFVLSVVWSTVFHATYTWSLTENMKKFTHEMCGQGPLDFTYSIDPMGMVYLSQDFDGSGDARSFFFDKIWKDVREIVDNEGRYGHLVRSVDPSVFNKTVHYFASQDWATMSGFLYNGRCDDALDNRMNADRVRWQSIVQAISAGISTAATCKDLRSLCFDASYVGQITRLFCSSTCGCTDPESKIATMDVAFGCPAACLRSRSFQLNARKSRCSQRTIAELNSTDFWGVWMSYAQSFAAGVSDANTILLPPAMALYGCDFLEAMPHLTHAQKDVITNEVCLGTTTMKLKPLATTCPKLCNCTWAGGMGPKGKPPLSCQSGNDLCQNIAAARTVEAATVGATEIMVKETCHFLTEAFFTISDDNNKEKNIIKTTSCPSGRRLNKSSGNSRPLDEGIITTFFPLQHNYSAGANIEQDMFPTEEEEKSIITETNG